MTTGAVLTPFASLSSVELSSSGRFRKLVLPVGSISYMGRTLHFTREYLSGLVDAFRDRAYDQVPFQLADDRNGHTNDPERTRGWVTGMQADDRGLWVEVEATPAGAAVLATNPQLGVSARIVEGYDRADGKSYPAAIQHVLGTLDPRIPAMGPWQPIEASNRYDAAVLDLSNYAYEGLGTWQFSGDSYPDHADDGDDLTEAEIDQILADSGELTLADLDELEALANDPDADPELIEAALALLGGEPATASLSNSYGSGGYPIELAIGELDGALEMARQQDAIELAQGEAYHQAEAARPRKATADDRLNSALDRLAQGTYVPGRRVAFASSGQRSVMLSQLRDFTDPMNADPDYLGACGTLDALGRCGEPNHSTACSAIYDADAMASPEGKMLLAEAALRPIGEGGTGQMLPGDWLEAATGVRLSHEDSGPFSSQRFERAGYVFPRRPVYGDPEEGGGQPLDDAATQLKVSQLRDAMGITRPERASRVARQQAVEDRRAAMKLRTPMQRAGLDTSHLETRSERAARTSARAVVPLEIDGVIMGYTKAAV